MAQLVTINVAQLVTIKMAKRGPVSNFTAYIYIYAYDTELRPQNSVRRKSCEFLVVLLLPKRLPIKFANHSPEMVTDGNFWKGNLTNMSTG